MEPKVKINYVYAQPDRERGGTVWGLGPEDFELVRQAYACAGCLEVFNVGGQLVQLPVCPTCRRKTALQGVDDVVGETPHDWVAYEQERNRALRGES